ncbi:MAG: AzlC family ABC transporter permease [Clostridiales bacterium]|nr:AzlC family ABC transporter permease [Clostridiales bacterium]
MEKPTKSAGRKANLQEFKSGIHHGIPVGLGYFFVSFTLGIAAKKTGLSAIQAALMSLSIHASAGEFAALGIIAAGAGYWEMALTEIIVNLRYLLMSCSLSQKISSGTKFFHRFLIAFDITDEIFAFSVSRPGKLNPFFTYGMMVIASPGWVFGTFVGAAAGGVLPAIVTGAMSIALYGMFISVIIPPARKDKVIAGVVIVSMLLSAAFALIPIIKNISSGFRIIILTVVISAAAAALFPVKEETESKETAE